MFMKFNYDNGYHLIIYYVNRDAYTLYKNEPDKVKKYDMVSPYTFTIPPYQTVRVKLGIIVHLFYNNKRVLTSNRLLHGGEAYLDLSNYRNNPINITRGDKLYTFMIDGFDRPRMTVEVRYELPDEFDNNTLEFPFNENELESSRWQNMKDRIKTQFINWKQKIKECYHGKDKYQVMADSVNPFYTVELPSGYIEINQSELIN